jgi:uncharacterized delta-60 repeat protein
MAFTRPFAYNPTQNPISGTEPYGTLVVGLEDLDYSQNPGGLKWWMGPDEELGYIIGGVVSGGTQPSPVGDVGTVRFWRTAGLNSAQFVSIANQITGQNFTSANEAKTWLDSNNYFASYEDPIALGYYIGGGFTFSEPQTYSGLVGIDNDGYLDTSIALNTGFNYSVECVTVDSSDRIYAGGYFTIYNGTASSKLIRLNSDGTYDSTFNVGSVGFSGTGTLHVYDILALSDGKVLVIGDYTTYKGTSANRIVRLNSDATIDNTFVYGTGFNAYTQFSILLNNGKYIVGGGFTSYNGSLTSRLIRLNTDGTKDTSFATGTFNDDTNYAAEQSDGKLIVVGGFTTYSGVSYNSIVRLNTDGSIDDTFVVGTGFVGYVASVAIQPDGKIILGGGFTSYKGVSVNRLIRLNSDGSVDSSFNVGTGFDQTVYNVNLLSNGKIYVGGYFKTYNGQKAVTLIRLNSDGSVDSTFNRDKSFFQQVTDTAVNSNGTVIASRGNVYGYVIGGVVKFGYDGAINIPYINNPLINNTVETIVKSSDGKLYYGGNFSRYGTDVIINRIARMNTDGSLDTTFATGTGFNGDVNTIIEDNNGKIVAAGAFTTYQGTSVTRICRLNTDATIDASFNSGTGFNSTVNKIVQDADGKYIVTGAFSTYNGTTVNRIARLNYDGSLDNSFTIGTGLNNAGYSVAALSSGKYLVIGAFTTFNGGTANRIIRLNSNGTKDTSFVYGAGLNQQAWAVVEQTDGKIVVGGVFTAYNNTTCNEIIRLNTDGTIDNTFTTGTGLNTGGNIYDMKLTPEGKILLGGYFSSYNDYPVNRVVLLNSDGTRDTAFDCPGVDNLVYAVEID